MKDIRIRWRFQVVCAERWHWKLTWLRRIEMLGLVSAGQFLVVDLALQLHERV